MYLQDEKTVDVKSSAHKHKIYACKVCLERKTEDVTALDHESKKSLRDIHHQHIIHPSP